MDISKTKRILAHYDISPARLCSEDEEVQEKEGTYSPRKVRKA